MGPRRVAGLLLLAGVSSTLAVHADARQPQAPPARYYFRLNYRIAAGLRGCLSRADVRELLDGQLDYDAIRQDDGPGQIVIDLSRQGDKVQARMAIDGAGVFWEATIAKASTGEDITLDALVNLNAAVTVLILIPLQRKPPVPAEPEAALPPPAPPPRSAPVEEPPSLPPPPVPVVLPEPRRFQLGLSSLLHAERARINAVPPDAVVEAQAALDQTLSDLGRGPSSGVRDTSPRTTPGDPEAARIARLIRRLRPFFTTSVLGALALIAPWLDHAPRAPRPSVPAITREVAAPGETAAFEKPAEASTAQTGTPRASSSPTPTVAGTHAGKRSAEPSSYLAREKMEAVIRAVRRGDSSASSATGERSGDASAELGPARALLQRRTGEE